MSIAGSVPAYVPISINPLKVRGIEKEEKKKANKKRQSF